MALVDLNTVKQYLGLTDSSEDLQLQLWIAYADAEIKDYLGWDVEQATYPGAAANGRGDSGYYSGDWSPTLILRQAPVTAIIAIYLDNSGYFAQNPNGSFTSATLLTDGVDYDVEWDGCLPGTSTPCSYSGIVVRIPDVWTGGIRRRIGEINPRYTGGNGNIYVQYTAGYPTVPPAITMAAVMFVAGLRRNAQVGGQNIQTESQGAYSYTLAAPAPGQPELGTIRQALARYKRMEI